MAGGAWAFIRQLSRGFGSSGRRPQCISSLVTSRSGVSGLPQSSLLTLHPAQSPTARAFYSSGSGLLQVSDLSRLSRLRLSLSLSLSVSLTPFQQGPPSLTKQVPSATRRQNLSPPIIISVCLDSFIQVIQDEQCAHSSSPSHVHTFMVHIIS